jgi:hypothetical protein
VCIRKRETVSYLQYVYALDFVHQKEGNCIIPTICLCAITLNRGWTQETHTTLVNNSRPNTNNKRHGSHQKLWWGWTLETHTTLVNNSRPNTNDKQHGSHQNLWRCELKRHIQHWWTTQDQIKKIPSMDPIKNCEGVNSRDTDNIGDSFSLFLTWSPRLSVCLMFTIPQFLMGSLLLILLVCSWLDHQCCLCVFCSPSPHVMMGSVLFISFLFLLENVGDQVKNKLKEWATGTPSKTREWWTEETQTTLVIKSRTNKKNEQQEPH